MTAPRHWIVIAVVESGRGIGDCGHQHADDEAAFACPWTPDPWPEVCDLLVRQVRTPDPNDRPRAPGHRLRQEGRAPRQLRIPGFV